MAREALAGAPLLDLDGLSQAKGGCRLRRVVSADPQSEDLLGALAANRIRKKAADFRLVASNSTSKSASNSSRKPKLPSLAFVGRNGLWFWYVRPSQVDSVLSYYHDSHGHLSEDITQRRLIGAHYWPTRMRDRVEFCPSCDSQFLGLRKPSQAILPILHLRTVGMLGMDYLVLSLRYLSLEIATS